MSVSLNSNLSANQALYDLTRHADLKFSVQNVLSSGERLSGAAPDGGQLSFAMGLRSALSRNSATALNVSNALSYLQAQAGALQHLSNVIGRMGDLATLMQDPTKSTSDLDAYAAEFQQFQREMLELTGTQAAAGSTSNGTGAQFNGMDLFTSTAGAVTTMDVGVSEDGSQSITINKADVNGLDVITLSSFWSPYPDAGAGTGYNLDWFAANISSVADATGLNPSFFSAIDTSIEKVSQLLADNGAQQSRLLMAAEGLRQGAINIEQAHGHVVDADIAQGSQELNRANVLLESSTVALRQANSFQQTLLELLTPRQ